MLLLTSTFVDYLSPDENISDILWYNKFVTQFSKMTVSCLVSQCNLTTEMFGEKKTVLDSIINNFIKTIPESSQRIRDSYKSLCMSAHICPGELKQDKEDRIFSSDAFIKEAEKNEISSRELVIRTMNANAFLNYFFLIEETIKSIYIDATPDCRFFTAKHTINKLLKEKLTNEDLYNDFNKEIYKRSKFFITFKSLSDTWQLLTLIRNRYVHHGNIYDKLAEDQFNQIVEKILDELKSDENELILTKFFFQQSIECFQKQINQSNSIIFDNVLENIIRNTSLFIMESLYICEVQKLKQQES